MRALVSLLAAASLAVAQSYPDRLVHAPTPVPDRVILTWSGDTATTQSVTWRTDTTVSAAVGQIAPATEGPSFEGGAKSVPATTTLLATDLNESHCHSVTFRNLKPKTKYVYRVGGSGNWSEWFQFETASDRPAPVGFVYVGDAQNDIRRHWSRLIRQAIQDMPRANFLLHAGDLINRGGADGEWGEWFQAMGQITGGYRHIPSPGNHEYGAPPKSAEELRADALDAAVGGGMPAKRPPGRASVVTSHWRSQFTLPDHGPSGLEETCYYIDVQGVRVICLNSMDRVEVQTPWLENVLKNNPNRWTVATFHVPMYSLTKARQEAEEKVEKAVKKQWRPVLEKYGVDLVLQGHDHAYGRSGLMRADNPLAGEDDDPKGTVYVVSVSGPKLNDLSARPWMVRSGEKKQFYQLIRIDGDKLHFEARTADGNLYDEFELRKGEDGRSRMVERGALDAERGGGSFGREALFAVGGVGLLTGGFAALRVRRKAALTSGR